jgi:fatty acid desaturase
MNEKREGKAGLVKQIFSGSAKILPFFERMSSKPPSQLLGFLKGIIVFFSMLILFLCALLWIWTSTVIDFIPWMITAIIILFCLTILTIYYATKLKLKEGI